MAEQDSNAGALWIDGEPYQFEDLTFREQHKMRGYVRELAPGSDGDLDEASTVDYIPAFITVIKQRTDESFTLDQAMEFKLSDLEEPEKPKAARKRPSKGSTPAA